MWKANKEKPLCLLEIVLSWVKTLRFKKNILQGVSGPQTVLVMQQEGQGIYKPTRGSCVLNLYYIFLKDNFPAPKTSRPSLIAPLPSQLLIQQQILISCISCFSHHFLKLNNKRANRIILVVNEGCSFVLLCALY